MTTAWDRLMQAGIALADEIQQLADEIRESCPEDPGSAASLDALISEWDAASSEMIAADPEGLAQMVLDHVLREELRDYHELISARAAGAARQILGQSPE